MSRGLKQAAYGVFYCACVGLVFLLLSGFSLQQQVPSCFDGARNQDETEVDCGGASCVSCEIKRLAPIQFSQVILLPSASGNGTTALVEIQNKNAAFGTAELSYALRFYDGSAKLLYEESDIVAVYPSEVKYRLVVNAPVDFRSVVRTIATTTEPVAWQPITQFVRPKTPLREVKFEYSPQTLRGSISGYIKNDNPFDLRRVTLSALLSEKAGPLVAASKTFVQDLVVGEERFFRIDVRLPEGTRDGSLADPKISLDSER